MNAVMPLWWLVLFVALSFNATYIGRRVERSRRAKPADLVIGKPVTGG